MLERFLVRAESPEVVPHGDSDAGGPGANDNASGTAMLLSLAKHYAQNPHKLSVAFIATGGEEVGLLGRRRQREAERGQGRCDFFGGGIDIGQVGMPVAVTVDFKAKSKPAVSRKSNKSRVILIDGSSLIYRAYNAIPSNFTASSGLHTNAIYGFALMFGKILAGKLFNGSDPSGGNGITSKIPAT